MLIDWPLVHVEVISQVYFQLLITFCKISPLLVPQKLIVDKLTLVQVMVWGYQAATHFCPCHNSTIAMSCAKICSDCFPTINVRAKLYFHWIWVVMENHCWNMPSTLLSRINRCSAQDCSNSIADALELLQSCTKPLKYFKPVCCFSSLTCFWILQCPWCIIMETSTASLHMDGLH